MGYALLIRDRKESLDPKSICAAYFLNLLFMDLHSTYLWKKG